MFVACSKWNSKTIFPYLCIDLFSQIYVIFVILTFANFNAASWFHPRRMWHLSVWWTLIEVIFTCFHRIEALLIMRILQGFEINSNWKIQGRASMAGVLEHPSQSLLISPGTAKKREVWHCPVGTRQSSDWTIPDIFHWRLPLISPVESRV